MARKPSEEKGRELTALRDWCLAVLNFIRDIDPTSPNNPPHRLHSVAENSIEAAFRRADLRGLKIVSRDLQEWVGGFPVSIQSKLDSVLRARFGSNGSLKAYNAERLRDVAG